MAPARKRTIQHSTHPGHLLAEVYMNKEYICDGCNTLGYGTRYRCDGCNFDLHEHCGTCPARFSSFMHPRHQLNLIFSHIDRICGVCGDRVEGRYYRCNLCNFDVHPLCTQLPQFVRHAMHPGRPLRLQPSSPTWCMVCKNVCTSWRYSYNSPVLDDYALHPLQFALRPSLYKRH
ncbi:hypothetical protein L1049_021434 [Liquidambar formosana]|uniref:DC1 domain-containing protein n=1 Tax=Liquidambar formosana TaxID=63359 RepID=A0AAP0R550_LIQFO